MLEIIEICGRMGEWVKGMFFSVDNFTYKEAMTKFKKDCLCIFKEKKNEMSKF